MVKESQTRRFCSCIKKVRKTLKSRKESGAIAICVTSVLQGKGRTLKKFRCKGHKARVITQTSRGGGISGSRPRSKSRSGSPIDPSQYYITLEPDGNSIKIHRPKGAIIVKEGDEVTGVRYINSTKTLPFRLQRILYNRDREIIKLTFKFIHEGKSISPTLHVGDQKMIHFENLRSGIKIPPHHFASLAKFIEKST